MKLIFEFDEQIGDRIQEAFCSIYNRPSTVSETDKDGNLTQVENPQSQHDFTLQKIYSYIKEIMVQYETNRDSKLAEKLGRQKAESEFPSLEEIRKDNIKG